MTRMVKMLPKLQVSSLHVLSLSLSLSQRILFLYMFVSQIIFIQILTVRACRNAIEFNSLSINKMVPGGYDAMKLNVILGVPSKYQHTLDLDQVKNVFPYGEIKFVVKEGGLVAPSGRIIESLGDKNDDMLIVAVAVQVGY